MTVTDFPALFSKRIFGTGDLGLFFVIIFSKH